MFREWGFLITEMVGLIIVAALLGVFVGWLIWGRRRAIEIESAGDIAKVTALEADLARCRESHAGKDDRIAALEVQLANTGAGGSEAPPPPSVADETAAEDALSKTATHEEVLEDTGKDYDGDGVVEGTEEGTKPETLSAPRDGTADDLKRIKGIGPKLEKLCFSLGFYHFDQIATWTPEEEAWVNANLEGFKGRVSRDSWIAQAKVLAQGGDTDFSKRVDGGDVY